MGTTGAMIVQFTGETPPEAVAMRATGVQRIVQVFEGQIARGLHPGGQLVVLRRGQVVLDRAAGLAHVRRRLAAAPDTPLLCFSFGKMYTALCVHQLIEQGRLEWDAPIARYWPAFGCKGKESATVRHALLHQAGVPLRGLYCQVWLWPDWERVTRHVAALPAEYPPGTRTAYHLVNFGFILGEVVRRVSGRPVEAHLRQAFLEPLGLRDTSMGLPRAEWPRAGRVYAGHPGRLGTAWLFNRRATRGAVVPAGNLYSTARDTAVLLQMLLNGGEYAGRRYLQPETIAAATALGYEGYDATQGGQRRWGHGFHLGGQIPVPGELPSGMGRGSSARTFGHFGMGTSMAWADPDAGLVVVFTCNRMLTPEGALARWCEISDAVWAAVV